MMCELFGATVLFGDGEAAVSGSHLNAVIGDAQADGEAECA
jgi:hypothetical protein